MILVLVMAFNTFVALALGFVLGRIYQIRSDELKRRDGFALPPTARIPHPTQRVASEAPSLSGAGGGGRAGLNQAAIADKAVNSGNAGGGARAWAEMQANSKKPGENVAAKLLSKDEARRIALNMSLVRDGDRSIS